MWPSLDLLALSSGKPHALTTLIRRAGHDKLTPVLPDTFKHKTGSSSKQTELNWPVQSYLRSVEAVSH